MPLLQKILSKLHTWWQWLLLGILWILPGIVIFVLIGRRKGSARDPLIPYPNHWGGKEDEKRDKQEYEREKIRIHDNYQKEMDELNKRISAVPDIDTTDYLEEVNKEI